MPTVSNLADRATTEQNTTGVLTPILTYDPEDGTLLRLFNRVAKGSEMGVPVFFDLRDSNDNPLPDDTEVVFRVQRPSDEEPIVVSEKIDNISSWNVLTTTEQRNEENIDAVKIDLKGSPIRVRYVDVLRVEINASAQVDWSNSTFEVYRKATQFVPFEA